MDAYLGEIRIFSGNYAPAGWAFCQGQQLSLLRYQALFTILGGAFGTDNKTYFCLPDLRGCVPMHQGSGAGLTPRACYSSGGSMTETLSVNEIPYHTHTVNSQTTATDTSPIGNVWANEPRGSTVSVYTETPNVDMQPAALSSVGGSQAHNNMQPFVALNYIICLEGIYPSKQ
ncbi:phage tail protein [Paenibacillus sp. y28]|uniref:phage tail protein n=1 Tax=Paenibacillus sp. y28 TaxID=3129110 RepID=UPI0030169668